jgi:UDP-GlcNAc:undecaprenyl-phosphate GlcNAc-1-phosphate transferase
MSFWAMLNCALVGLGIMFLVVPLILGSRRLKSLMERGQDLHHTHQHPIPRLGGLALLVAYIGVEIFIALVCPEARSRISGRSVVFIGSLAMFGLGFWDDFKPLGARRKLLVQILVALIVCAFGIGIQGFKIPFATTVLNLGGWGVLLTVVWLVGMTNLINLIDGVDGLAGGICLMLMGLLVYVGHSSGSFECMMSGMAGALLGFLWFNFPPARIYLGDGGAYLLGFQIGVLAILNSHKGTVFAALVAPLFVLALPILDTSLAILRRGLRGLPIFRPDRRHLHHRLLQMGLSRRKVVLSFYAVTLVFLLMGFAAYWSRGGLIPVLLGGGTLLLLICAGKLRFSRNWFAVGRVVGHSLSMRQEVQYAMTLVRWLELEGNRRASAEELWGDLLFAAQRLGYTSVKITLADGERVWSQPNGSHATRSAVQVLQGGRLGTLELTAHSHDPGMAPAREFGRRERSPRPSIADGHVFEIVSELLAEGWVKATSRLLNGDQAPLCFGTERALHADLVQSRFPFVYAAPARVARPNRQPDDSPVRTVQ